MTPEEQARLQRVEDILSHLLGPDRYTFQNHIQVLDARHIQFGKSNGTKIGTEATQKIGFYGTTPIVQASAISQPSGAGTAGVDTSARTAINSLIAALHNIGITA